MATVERAAFKKPSIASQRSGNGYGGFEPILNYEPSRVSAEAPTSDHSVIKSSFRNAADPSELKQYGES